MVLITSTMSKPFNAILNHFKKYYGYSKTEQVLKFSKKLKRKPSVYSFVLGKDKLSIL